MIYFGCPACGTPMASPDSQAGLKEKCPDCGNVAMVPPATPSTPPAAKPAETSPVDQAAANKPANVDSDSAESVLWTGRPSHWHYSGRYLLSGLLLLSAGLFSGTPESRQGAAGAAVMAGLLIIWCVLSRMGTHYKVTSRRVTSHEGLLSRRDRDIPIGPISEVRLTQGIVARIIGIGTVGFSTAASSGVEVTFAGIPNPLAVRKIVQEHSRA